MVLPLDMGTPPVCVVDVTCLIFLEQGIFVHLILFVSFYLWTDTQNARKRYIHIGCLPSYLPVWLTDCLPACLLTFRLRSFKFYILWWWCCCCCCFFLSTILLWLYGAGSRADYMFKHVYECMCVCVFVLFFFRAGLLFWNGCSDDLIMYAISPKIYMKK